MVFLHNLDKQAKISNLKLYSVKESGEDKIITIDFRQPELSTKINILEPIINEYEKYIEYEKEYEWIHFHWYKKYCNGEEMREKYNKDKKGEK